VLAGLVECEQSKRIGVIDRRCVLLVLEFDSLIGLDAPHEAALALVDEFQPVVAGRGHIKGPHRFARGLPTAHLRRVFPFTEFFHPIDALFGGVIHLGELDEQRGRNVRKDAECGIDFGRGLQFDGDHGRRVVGGCGRHLQLGPSAALRPFDRDQLAIGDDAGRSDIG